MLEMLKARKAQLEAQGKKGFTLMEMLIVIAIIAILIAIAIPTFTAQLNRANAATDEANIRAGYASAVTEAMLDTDWPESGSKTYYLLSDGSVSEDSDADNIYECKGRSQDLGLTNESDQTANPQIGNSTISWTTGDPIRYTADSNRTISIAVGAGN